MSKRRYKSSDENAKYGAGEMLAMYENAYKRLFFRKKRVCPLAKTPIEEVNYKNIPLLNRFVSERGRILPNRITYLSTKNQRKIKGEIKKARILALMPFVKY